MSRPKGFKHSVDTKKRWSLIRKGRHFSPKTEFKKGNDHPFYGGHHSEEWKQERSEAMKGKNNPNYGKYGELNSFYGEKHSRELKRKFSLKARERFKDKKNHPMYGKHRSEETKNKISKAKIGKSLNEETKRKISLAMKGEKNPFYGKKLSEEWKRKMNEARKKTRFPTHHTKPELKFIELINKYNLPYKYVGDGKFWIENINPDFVDCNGEKVAVEIFGDYWHDPKQRKNIRWSYTEEGRKEILAKYGWECIIIWEKELKNLSDKDILKKINGGL